MKKKIFIVSIITLFIDLFTKYLTFSLLSVNESKTVIKDFFYILPTKNNGAAFSSFAGNQVFLIIVSIAILVYLITVLKKQKESVITFLSYGLLIGGLLGNLFDRVVFHYVRDFLSFHLFKYEFAIFNIADVGIVVGAILLLIFSFVGEKKYEN